MTQPPGPAWRLPILAVFVSAAAFFLLQDTAFDIAGGVFEYPLDDPYIHLAIAEQIVAGGYGINLGEPAAAASSVLYPILLIPFVGTEWHRFVPLVWNVFGLLVAAFLWGRILWQAGYGRSAFGAIFAIAGPVAFNMVGLTFIGMEHMLHTAASLAIVLGLLLLFDEGRISGPLVLGIFLAPLLRFEGMALAFLAAGAVCATGRWHAGMALVALAVGPAILFSVFLLSLGLGPLPSSIMVKLTPPSESDVHGVLDYVLFKLYNAVTERREFILTLLLVLTALFTALPTLRKSPRWLILPVVGGAGLAHLMFGRFGWMDRYEIYILVTVAAGLLAVAPARSHKILPALVIVPMLFSAFVYVPLVAVLYPLAPRALNVQQGEMARFAKDFLKEPVAVNDIGYVAWRNPDYVLDIWGLANAEAYDLRMKQGGPRGWVNRLVEDRGVGFAMVYDHWLLPEEIGGGWRLLGQLKTDANAIYLGGDLVNFYLVDTGTDSAPYLKKLRNWAAGLPQGASFTFAEEVGG